jgi:hypothetical protein
VLVQRDSATFANNGEMTAPTQSQTLSSSGRLSVPRGGVGRDV